MKRLTSEDLNRLQYGDIVYKFKGVDYRKLHFVAKMPNDKSYLIFCEGEHLEHLYIHTDGTFRGDFYSGEVTLEDLGKLLIENIDNKIEDLKRDRKYTEEIYIKNK